MRARAMTCRKKHAPKKHVRKASWPSVCMSPRCINKCITLWHEWEQQRQSRRWTRPGALEQPLMKSQSMVPDRAFKRSPFRLYLVEA